MVQLLQAVSTINTFLYPISGSDPPTIAAVTHAMIENWQYMEVIREAADPKCSARLEGAIKTIDSLLAKNLTARIIKSQFGVSDLEHNEDFAALLEVCLIPRQLMPVSLNMSRSRSAPGKRRCGIRKWEARSLTNFANR